ncbi:metalloregulator ArsR/SmtB family transcription factor [Lentisphaerota bacterium ZTH]|nr:helix-turn-helix transcriptional regulator [Lentisphaerota bacterium]WET06686.1 metalloregulator ArsR/SmtB family transcription factor [Lentisphaerota bacterium ZTH]
MPISEKRMLERVKVIKALAHPSRLAMVEKLAGKECCVCELQQLIGDDFSTVSKHLSLLKNSGLVDSDKRGVQVFYRLRVPCITDFLDCVEKVLSENKSSTACKKCK